MLQVLKLAPPSIEIDGAGTLGWEMRIREASASVHQTNRGSDLQEKGTSFWGAGFSLHVAELVYALFFLFQLKLRLHYLFIRWLGKFGGRPAVAHVSRCRSGWLEEFWRDGF